MATCKKSIEVFLFKIKNRIAGKNKTTKHKTYLFQGSQHFRNY